MNQLNSVMLEGNLTRDVEVKDFVAGFKVAQFTIAANRTYKNSNGELVDEVSYFDIKAYGNMAEMFSDKLKKGRGVRIVGRLKQERWKDKNGKACSKVVVIAEHIEVKPLTETKKGEGVCL